MTNATLYTLLLVLWPNICQRLQLICAAAAGAAAARTTQYHFLFEVFFSPGACLLHSTWALCDTETCLISPLHS